MANELRGKRVAALVEDGFEQVELVKPKEALQKAGAQVDVVSPQPTKVKGWDHTRWGSEVSVDRRLDDVSAGEYDALLLPGGVMNPDRLRVTSYPSLATDLRNAGAEWVDEQVVVDNGLVTSRKPDDIPAFNEKMIEEIAEGQHEPGRRSRKLTGANP